MRDAFVQRSVPSRAKTAGGREDATQHNKKPFEFETNKSVRARKNVVWGIFRGMVICRPRKIKSVVFKVGGERGERTSATTNGGREDATQHNKALFES